MMIDDDNDGQMIFRDLGGLKLPHICLTGEEKSRKNVTQETCPDRGSNPGPLRDRCACYHLAHSGGRVRNHIPPFLHTRIIHFVLFTFIYPCDVDRYPCYSKTVNKGVPSHLILQPSPMSDTSWGLIFINPLPPNLYSLIVSCGKQREATAPIHA